MNRDKHLRMKVIATERNPIALLDLKGNSDYQKRLQIVRCQNEALKDGSLLARTPSAVQAL